MTRVIPDVSSITLAKNGDANSGAGARETSASETSASETSESRALRDAMGADNDYPTKMPGRDKLVNVSTARCFTSRRAKQ